MSETIENENALPVKSYLYGLVAKSVLFLLCLLVYGYFYQAGGWNQNSRFDLIRSIVDDGVLHIDRYSYNTGDLSEYKGHYYCDKAPGLSIIGVFPYALIKFIGSELIGRKIDMTVASYFVTIIVVAMPSAITVVMLYVLLNRYMSSCFYKITTVAGYAFGTLALPYSTILYGHQTAAAFLFIPFALLVSSKNEQIKAWVIFVVGVILGLSMVVDYTSIIAVAPVCAYAYFKVNDFNRFIYVVLGVLLALMMVFIYNTICFGGPLTIGYFFSTHSDQHLQVSTWLKMPKINVLHNILFSQYRGLFYSSPWLILCAVGLLSAVINKYHLPEFTVVISIVFGYLCLNSSLVAWEGGWAVGPRYLIPMLPFMSLGIVGLGSLSVVKNKICLAFIGLLLLLLCVYSVFMMMVATAVTPEVPFSVKAPYNEYLLPLFYDGNLSINTQSIDAYSAKDNVAICSWNFGILFGLNGLKSLIPLAVLFFSLGAFLLHCCKMSRRQ